MNHQKVYEDVCTHLITQNAKSMRQLAEGDGEKSCAYRGENGLKCAIGGIMPDEIYNVSMEGKTPSSPNLTALLNYLQCSYKTCDNQISVFYEGSDIKFLEGLQTIHDSRNIEDWKKELTKFGNKNNLQIPSILE